MSYCDEEDEVIVTVNPAESEDEDGYDLDLVILVFHCGTMLSESNSWI